MWTLSQKIRTICKDFTVFTKHMLIAYMKIAVRKTYDITFNCVYTDLTSRTQRDHRTNYSFSIS